MHFYTLSIGHPNGEITRRRIAADSIAEARTIAWRIAGGLGREVSSVEVWL